VQSFMPIELYRSYQRPGRRVVALAAVKRMARGG
jgi:hypothetical protein